MLKCTPRALVDRESVTQCARRCFGRGWEPNTRGVRRSRHAMICEAGASRDAFPSGSLGTRNVVTSSLIGLTKSLRSSNAGWTIMRPKDRLLRCFSRASRGRNLGPRTASERCLSSITEPESRGSRWSGGGLVARRYRGDRAGGGGAGARVPRGSSKNGWRV
jgi:hypothetical protein